MADSETDTESHDESTSDLEKTAWFLGSIAAGGFVALLFWALTFGEWNDVGRAFSLGMLIAGTTALIGGVLGLLFGIPKWASEGRAAPRPKSEATEKTRPANAPAEPKEENDAPRTNYSVNTNLEQISDWLTKIIVGVSLTQVDAIKKNFFDASEYFGKVLPPAGSDTSSNSVIAALLIAFGLTGGFLAGYLITRIYLPGAFSRAEQVLRRRISKLETQSAEDKRAIQAAAESQGVIYTDLYRYKQKGFENVIQRIGELFREAVNQKNPALWTYLAAAHGQAYQWETEHEKNRDRLKEHRDEALKAVDATLALSEEWRPILQLMWDKRDPTKRKDRWAKNEDDLEVFYNDPEFKKLLGPNKTPKPSK